VIPDPVGTDRAIGALLGLATGDALGAGYEFTDEPADPIEMIGGGPFALAPGEWTDDTAMAVAIAEVAATGDINEETIGDRFLEWYRSGPPDVGNQTRAVLDGATSGAELTASARAYHERNPSNSAGNGSLMRTAPVALVHLGDDDAIVAAAREVSALTHADPLCTDACVLWCIAIDRAIRFGRLDGVRDGLGLVDDAWHGWVDAAEREPMETFKPNGFVVTALQAAYAAIVQTPIPGDVPCTHLQDALRNAVRIGHDTDTVAAIAGMVLGARWGSSAIPLAWKAKLHGWPGYRARDLVRLAALAYHRGSDDHLDWPSVPSLLDRYVEQGYPPRATALPDDPDVLVGSAAALQIVEVDVVVSLCRMGTQEPGSERHDVYLIDDLDANPNLDFVLADTAEQIVRWRDEGRTVFLHCAAGVSRTPTVAAAYLTRRLGISGAEALDRVERAMAWANPNPAFREALRRL